VRRAWLSIVKIPRRWKLLCAVLGELGFLVAQLVSACEGVCEDHALSVGDVPERGIAG
jgi:hypothetical protein